ncbi:glycosyltransferase family 4 protein [Patescibacteria group bacterium]|nr:glycosyltransferase family 4 protein [Patescibacteria group bacterium]
MKKVLIFSLNYYPRFIGGAEVAIKEITDRLTDTEFHVLTLRFDSTLPKKEVIGRTTVHRIGFAVPNPSIGDLKKFPLHFNKHYYQLAAVGKALALHRQHHFDGIWAMMAHSCAIPAGIVRWRTGVPYLLTLQEGDPPEYIERTMRPVFPLFKNGFTSATHLQAISSFLLAWGMRMGFKGDSVVIPNAVDTARFGISLSPAERAQARETIGLLADDVALVTTSRLVHKNALDDVIAALPLLSPNVKFVVYGIGPDEEKLRDQVQELGLTDRVMFMGQLNHVDMPRALAACDIFIRPSRSEGMGNSFVEAMAAGLPVIATQEGGIADFLFDATRNPDRPTTGWAVDANAPLQISKAVQDIISHPEKVAEVLKNARALAVEKYDWETVAKDMRNLFTRMLGNAVP